MKKFLTIILSLALMVSMLSGVINADDGGEEAKLEVAITGNDLKIGDYFTLGKYNDAPIVWRYVADDENGKLIVSDKILAIKAFDDDNLWAGSYLRKWLNSSAAEGEVNWGLSDAFIWFNKNEINLNEKGFLNETNFSQGEKGVIKTVTQWTMLPEKYLYLSKNGRDKAYKALKFAAGMGSPGDPVDRDYYEYSEFPEIYSGAAYEVTDTVFLLDEMQIFNMWKNIGSVRALCVDGCKTEYSDYSGEYRNYFLRTPSMNLDIGECTLIDMYGNYGSGRSYETKGVCPAFYLNSDNALILSGKGTAEDPYMLDGKYLGEVVSTDITAQIGGNPIPSYNISGNTAISAEDLSDYGFDVTYDDTTRTLKVNRSVEKAIVPIDSADERFVKNGTVGKKLYDIYRSDIKVYLDGKQIESFNIDGRTMIYIDDLGKYGSVVWDGDSRRISVNFWEN